MTQAGQILDERYRLDKRIAAGGVGQVWQARDLLLERPVALKVLRPEYADHPDTLDRFRKEARLAGALSHPHVAQVYDYGPAGADWPPYLVMEFVDGPSLADLLAVGPIEPVVALDVIAQAADGLSAAHQAGLVHRDVKPGNILISSQGQVKVTDFGIAHTAGQTPITGPGLVMGTTQYMAPERIAGAPASPASDLYALGIVLHECLTGVPPFEGNPADVMAAHLYLPLPPLPAGVPPELDVLVARLTVKDPSRRIGDAGELAEMAAGQRDALMSGSLVPSVRAAVHSGPGTAVADPLTHSAALVSGQAQGSGPAGPGLFAAGAGYAAADGAAATAAAGMAGAGAIPAPPGLADVSDEWAVPPHMSQPAGTGVLAPDGQPRRGQRRRTAAFAVGAAVVAATAMGGLLVSGALHSAPAGNSAPPGTSATSAATRGARPSPRASASPGSASPVGTAGSGAAAVPGVTAPATARGGTPVRTRGPASPSASASGSAPASTSPGPSGSPSPTSPAPSPAPPTSPSSAPGTSAPPTATPAPSTPPPSCLLGICL